MTDLFEFSHPQLLAGVLALVVLGLAIGVEVVLLGLSLRRAGVSAEPAAMPEPSVDHDFYDWLYE